MPRSVKRRKYKSTKFGEGMQPGTVDSELARRQVRKQRKLEDAAFERRVSERAGKEPTGFWFLAAVGRGCKVL
jgi:hypothetical protein